MSRCVVVGAGLSGLVAARRLVLAGHDVAVVEGKNAPGGWLRSVRVPTDRGRQNDRRFRRFEVAFTENVYRLSISMHAGGGGCVSVGILDGEPLREDGTHVEEDADS